MRAIRRFARKLRDHGRPFVLPQSLDLGGCLDAVERRLKDERVLQEEIGRHLCDELDAVRSKFDKRERQVQMRILALQLLLHAAYKPNPNPGARDPDIGAAHGRSAPGASPVGRSGKTAADGGP